MADTQLMEKLVALCKRRGFIFPSSEIYGGIGGFWDYGPLGVELKRNIKNQWWRDMITSPPAAPAWSGLREVPMVGVDTTIIMNPKVWEASGHAGGFADPMVSCKADGCKKLYRADQLWHVAVRFTALGDDATVAYAVVADTPDAAEEQVRSKADKLAKKNRGAEYILSTMPYLQAYENNAPGSIRCANCDTVDSLTEPRAFNLMFETYVGALQDAANKVYLRPETAQGIFVNFLNVLDTSRVKLPFGVGQVGKSFRNEVNPRNFTFRSREFEQMEIEFFCKDEDSLKWYEFWRKVRYDWYVNLGLRSEKLRLRDQGADELAHYSRACADIEYLFPFSDEHQELEGVAHRGCYDLEQHAKHSGRDLRYFDDDGWQAFMRQRKEQGLPELTKEEKARENEKFRFLPTVIEPSAGADRAALAFLCEAYHEDQAPNEKGKLESRVVMRFHPKLAPIKAAFLPLVSREGMPDVAYELYREARRHFNVFFDEGGSIGRRYRRQDEAGTPYCITVDGDTLKDGTVTIRDRDSLEQIRVPRDELVAWLRERIEA